METQQHGELAQTNWKIPDYAQALLWVEGDFNGVRIAGETGAFVLDESPEYVTVRWGGGEGAALARLAWQGKETLGWDGGVRVGGYIDAVHITEIPGLESPVMCFFVGGQPLKQDFSPYPTAAKRGDTPYLAPDFYTGLAAEVPESTSCWLVSAESLLADTVREAMSNSLRLYLFGHLAAESGGWHRLFALPVLLESVTVFAP